MDENERPAGRSEPYRPEFRDPRSAWRWWGFLLIVLGTAGLLFHHVWDIPVTRTGEGKAALAAVAAGIALVATGFLMRRR
jgi:hypothetical protein